MSQSCCGFDSMVPVVRVLGYAAISLSVYRGLPDWIQRAIRCPPLRSTLVVFGLLMSGLDLWVFKGLFSKPIARHRVSTARQVTAAWGFQLRAATSLSARLPRGDPLGIYGQTSTFAVVLGAGEGVGGGVGHEARGRGALSQVPRRQETQFRNTLLRFSSKPTPRNPNQL